MSNFRYVDQLGYYQPNLGAAALGTTDFQGDGKFYLPTFANNQSDAVSYIFQLNHTKKLGAPITSIHIHMVPLGNSDGDVVFNLRYHWIGMPGVVIPAPDDWTPVNNITIGIIGTRDYNTEVIANLAENISSPTSGEGYSSILLVWLQRPTGDSYAGDVGLLHLDVHYPTDRQGSIKEYTDE